MKQKLRPKKIERFHLPAMWQSYSYVCVGNKKMRNFISIMNQREKILANSRGDTFPVFFWVPDGGGGRKLAEVVSLRRVRHFRFLE